MGILNQVGQYLFFRKKTPDKKPSRELNFMHGVNRLSIFLFILAMIILAVKLLWKRG